MSATARQKTAFIVINFLLPRLKKEKMDIKDCPISPIQIARLAQIMKLENYKVSNVKN